MTRYCLMMSLAALLFPANVDAQQATEWRVQSTVPAGVRSVYPAPMASPAIAGHRMANDEMQKALANIKDAESEADKDKAKETLRGLLEDQYDKSLDQYAEYLDEMQKKISDLREQLDRRREAKMEMVELRLQVLVSDADGLGWPDQRSSHYFSMPGQTTYSPLFSRPQGLPIAPPTTKAPDAFAPTKNVPAVKPTTSKRPKSGTR